MSTVVNAQTYRMTTSSTLVPLSSVHPGTEWTVSDVSLVDDGPLQVRALIIRDHCCANYATGY